MIRVRIFSLALAGLCAACAHTPPAVLPASDLAAVCASLPQAGPGETVVVMRDKSTSTKAAGVGPGIDALGDTVAVVGPVAVTSDVTAGRYSADNVNVEMKPCP